MLSFFRQFIIAVLLASFLIPSIQATAQTDSSTSTFNPNYIISDTEIQDWQAMSLEDIQAFLEEKKGALANMILPDTSGTPRLAAAIIAKAAADYRISPKYLLVKLQKEQSLVTEKQPNQKQLDWATGYAICDGCSMEDPALQKNRGFGKQVDSAAGIMRWYYNNVYISPIIKKPNSLYSIDNTAITPMNLATAFLYTYTPHIHGNKNFWRLWQTWFEQLYPDGTLVKTSDSTTVYLIADGQKRPFANETALITRFDPTMILAVSPSQLARYETGPPITIPNYSILFVDGTYYLVNYDILRPFADQSVVAKLGYNPDEIITASTTDIAGFELGAAITLQSTGSPLGSIIRVKENQQLYFLLDSVYHLISDPAIAKNRFPNMAIEAVPISSLASSTRGEPLLFKDGTLTGNKLTNRIYVIEHGLRRHIPTEAVFSALQYNFDSVIWVDEFTEMYHPIGQPISLPSDLIDEIATDGDAAMRHMSPNSVMVLVPEENTEYIGEKFATPVNTYLVAEAETGKILAGKNVDAVRPMASFAKIITAYRVLTTGLDIKKYTTYRPKRDAALYNHFRITEGERVGNADLLDAMLVSSLNTPVNMLVANVDTDKKRFVKGLNALVKGWGIKKTVFADASGENPKTVTSAREYFTLYRKTTGGKIIPPILAKKNYKYTEVRDIDKKPSHFDSHSNHLMEKTDLPFTILMSKTGYLDEAGAGLVMTVERKTDGKKFVMITMGNPDYPNRFVEPERLARWAIVNF